MIARSARRALVAELRRAGAVLGTGLLLGLLTGGLAWWLVAVLVAYLVWHLAHAWRALRWVAGLDARRLPDAGGLWEALYTHLEERARAAARRERQLSRTIVEQERSAQALPDAVVALDRNLHIRWSNRAAERLLGVRHPQDIGQPIENLLRDPGFVASQRRRSEQPVTFASPPDPERVVSVRVIPYAGGQHLLVARDVTDAHRLERVRRDFVSNVSHELRTPLTILGGYLETLVETGIDAEDDPKVTERRRRALEAMGAQVARMSQLVEDLLTLSRIESRPMGGEGARAVAPVDVGALAAALGEEARRLSGAGGHRISVEAQPGVRLLADARELRAAFGNLVTNAVRYTPPGGEIRIRWWQDGGGAHFQVADTGIGVEPEHIGRLTERFYRVDPGRSREQGGTGLGLAIVKHVLEHSGARLEIESTPGEGSRFTCHFPPERVVVAETPSSAVSSGSSGG